MYRYHLQTCTTLLSTDHCVGKAKNARATQIVTKSASSPFLQVLTGMAVFAVDGGRKNVALGCFKRAFDPSDYLLYRSGTNRSVGSGTPPARITCANSTLYLCPPSFQRFSVLDLLENPAFCSLNF